CVRCLGMASPTEQHLLFGVLAFRLGFVDADALAVALRCWTSSPSRSLPDFLHLSPDECFLIASLADAHLRRHDNDPLRSLADLLPPGSIPVALLHVEDREVHALLDRLDRGGPSARTEGGTVLTGLQTLAPGG